MKTRDRQLKVLAKCDAANKTLKEIKYHTDSSGHCEVLCRKKVIARAFVGQNGYSVRVLQGMNRDETMKKIREDCPEFLTANFIPDNYYPYLFSK